ncbi:uncharacterized protein LOC134276948 [Saccostrea cucullata]|uniref:uncharacterized protein LOC134276948 n=1 Tax=Saccostrea cuccullata TaxID=36930 RepID=UPI002ED6262E
MFWGSMTRLLFAVGFLAILHTAYAGLDVGVVDIVCVTTEECRARNRELYCEAGRCRCPRGRNYDPQYGCVEGCNPLEGEAACNFRGDCRLRSSGRYECDCDRGYEGSNCMDRTTTTTTTRRRGGAIGLVAAAAGIPIIVLAAAAAIGASALGK